MIEEDNMYIGDFCPECLQLAKDCKCYEDEEDDEPDEF